MAIIHVLSATTPDDPAFEIRPSHWNSQHVQNITIVGNTAGASTMSGTDIQFSGGPNVTLSVDGNSLVFSGGAGAAGNTGFISAGVATASLGTVVFSNSNGVSFGVNGQTVTAQHNAITTGMASNRGSDFVQATAAFAGTNASGTIASDGISVSVGNYITTQSAQAFSANASSTFQTLSFQDSNGVSFSNNAGAIRITHGLQYTSATSAITANALNTSATTVFSNSNNVSFGLNGSTITATASFAAQTDQTIGFYGSSQTTGSASSGTMDARSLSIIGAGAISVGMHSTSAGGTTTGWIISGPVISSLSATGRVSIASNGATISIGAPHLAFSADASSTFSTLSFQNTSNVSFSNNAGAIRISHNLAGTGTAITGNASITLNSTGLSFNGSGLAGTVTAKTGGAVITLNSAGLSFDGAAIAGTGTAVTGRASMTLNSTGLSFNGSGLAGTVTAITGNAVMTFNSAGFSLDGVGLAGTSTGFAGAGISGSITHNSSGINLSLSVDAHKSYFKGLPDFAGNTQTFSFGQSTSYITPFVLENNYSFDRMRVIASGSVAASSTQATTGNTSLSMSGITSHNIVLYSRGVAGNSQSLQYVTSTQHVDKCLMTISYNANSTQYQVSLRYTLGLDSFTKDYSISSGTVNWHTSHLTDLTGVKYLDIGLGLSLSPGQWWIGYGRSTTFATQANSISVATRMLVSQDSMIANSMNTLAIGMLGGNTNSSVGWRPGHGSFTTSGAAGTTSSVGLAVVSTTASNNILFYQLMRIA